MSKKIARTTLWRALGVALLGMTAVPAWAQNAATPTPAPAGTPAPAATTAPASASALDLAAAAAETAAAGQPTQLEELVVSGFRRSVQYATEAKRESTNFTDSVFAEDIGKFPDLNIAESLNRIPGIQLTRDVNGEGLNVAIRGLPTSFTKTTINGAQIATASIGLDAQNQNREVDLNLFPTEFFTQLTVNKSPKASLIEGGVSGVVDMRSLRPFDTPDDERYTYQFQLGWNDIAEEVSPSGAFTGSWKNDAGTFGALVGVSTVRGNIGVHGFETIGWTNPGLNYQQCGVAPPAGTDPTTVRPAECNPSGGGGWLIPNTVPDNPSTIAAGLTPGQVIDDDLLLALNPGLTILQISDALMPRLGRPVDMSGDRDRDAFVASFEARPNDEMRFYVDMLYSQAYRANDRLDMNLVGRVFGPSGLLPMDMQLDENGVVTSATFTNAQFFLEARPYREDVDYWHINPGANFWFNDGQIRLDLQANHSRSWMFRESPTILVNSPFDTIQYTNDGELPSWETTLDLNDPNLGWTWAGGRVNVQNERRETETTGGRADLQFGEDNRNVRVGLAYDEASRTIQGFDNSAAWQAFVFSEIPTSELASYLRPGPHGFITVDFDRFMRDTNYAEYRDNAPESAGPNTGGSTGGIDESTIGGYVEINGDTEILGRTLRFNAGARYVTTDQEISGPVTIGGVRQWQTLEGDYDEILPSFNVAWDVHEDVVLRLSSSRTLTRPNPSSMLPNTVFTDQSALNASQGNPNLTPYLSTNIDLGGEWYTGDEGYVGLTLFNKRITGYTYQGVTSMPFSQLGIPYADLTPGQQGAIDARGGPDAALVNVQQQVNADGELDIRGYEAIWVQPLDGWVEGLGFMANYTHISLEASGKDAARLASNVYGIAPNLWNATVYWENEVFSARLSYTWNDELVATGPNQQGIPYAQLIGEERGQLDFSASWTLRGIASEPQITLNVINITGEPRRSNFYFSNAVNDYYDPGTTVMVGIRGSF